MQQPDDAVALIADGAGLGEVGHRLGDVEEVADATGRRGVDHHGVVDAVALLVGVDDPLFDLPGEQDVAQPGGDGGDEVDGADALHRAAGEAEVVEHVEVFEQGVLDVDRERRHLSATLGGRDARVGRRQRRDVEELRDALTPFAFHEQHPFAVGGQREGECRGDRRLAGTALPDTKCRRAREAASGHVLPANSAGSTEISSLATVNTLTTPVERLGWVHE